MFLRSYDLTGVFDSLLPPTPTRPIVIPAIWIFPGPAGVLDAASGSRAAIRIAARSHRHTSTAKDHSPGLIIFLSRELGTLLPQPAYLETAIENGLRIPEEVPADDEFEEGAVTQVLVNRYERDPAARERCIQHYGTDCFVCRVSFADRYGPEINGLIHVHHLTAIASIGRRSSVDPIRDLRPVCPNCHAVLHRKDPCYSLDDVLDLLKQAEESESV